MFEAAVARHLTEVALRRPDGLRRPGDPRKSWEGDLMAQLRSDFTRKRLNRITADDIRAYQAARVAKGKSPATVNHQVKALLRPLKRAELRHLLADGVRMLPVKREPRQMLTPAEKQRLFETAAKRPSWQRAYCAALLTASGSMRPCGLKRLIWRDLDPVNRTLVIRRSKTEAGTQIIPLNDEAWSAIVALKQSADALGTYAPENFVLHREWPRSDGTSSMGRNGWRKAWRSLRREAGKGDEEPVARLSRLRYYDLRRQFVTELNEAGVPEGVIRELAGHVDPQMMRVYSHPRLAAKRAAVEVLSAVKMTPQPALPEGGRVINRVIDALPVAEEASQVIEETGRGARI
jgi:integrase